MTALRAERLTIPLPFRRKSAGKDPNSFRGCLKASTEAGSRLPEPHHGCIVFCPSSRKGESNFHRARPVPYPCQFDQMYCHPERSEGSHLYGERFNRESAGADVWYPFAELLWNLMGSRGGPSLAGSLRMTMECSLLVKLTWRAGSQKSFRKPIFLWSLIFALPHPLNHRGFQNRSIYENTIENPSIILILAHPRA